MLEPAVCVGCDENSLPNPDDNERDDISADLTPESHKQPGGSGTRLRFRVSMGIRGQSAAAITAFD